jgi:hypothetical protein
MKYRVWRVLMNLFFIFLGILLIFFIPIPIKFSIYYSTIDYYVKLYGFTVVSKKEIHHKLKAKIKKEDNLFFKLYKHIERKSLISTINNLKFKPSLKMKLYLDYSLNDAARTAIFYGVLSQLPPLIYMLIKIPFNISKFDFKIRPIFKDIFLLKIETSSIIFVSFANIIYIIIILFKYRKEHGR